MTTDTLIRAAMDAGVALAFVDGKLSMVGRVEAVRAWAPRLRERKPELTQFLTEAHATTTALIRAAMQACDFHGDDDKAREEMRQQCMDTPRHLQADLLSHFQQNYPRATDDQL